MRLNDFLMIHNLTMTEFAVSVGTTAATISRIVDGSVMPRRALMLRIYQATHGLVTPNDIADIHCTKPCRDFTQPSTPMK